MPFRLQTPGLCLIMQFSCILILTFIQHGWQWWRRQLRSWYSRALLERMRNPFDLPRLPSDVWSGVVHMRGWIFHGDPGTVLAESRFDFELWIVCTNNMLFQYAIRSCASRALGLFWTARRFHRQSRMLSTTARTYLTSRRSCTWFALCDMPQADKRQWSI